MSDFQIISDGSCDLSAEQIEQNQLMVVPFYVSFDEKTYLKEGKDISVRDFYQRLVDHPSVYPKSSMPSTEDYMEVFVPLIEQGKGIICICITTKFSGSYNAACVAKKMCEENYPHADIAIIDATVNTCLQGLLVLEACRMQQNGLSMPETIANIERIKPTARIFFTVGNMDYLRHGGRIGKLIGIVGATLHIKPIIVLTEGEIFPCGITMTRKKSLIKVMDYIRAHFSQTKEQYQDYNFVVGYGYDQEEGTEYRNRLVSMLGLPETTVAQIGATIGVHTGPFPIGCGLIKRYDTF